MLLMNKILKVIVISSLLLTSIYANEENRENLFLGVDFSIANDVAKNGCKENESRTLFGTLKAGYNLNSKPIRVYASYTPIKWDYAKANLMQLNGDYLINFTKEFSLFAGLSLGYTNLKGSFSGKESKYNYGLQSGVIYKLSEKLNLEMSYKYINTNDIKAIHNQNFLSLENFNIFNLGVIYNF